MGIDAGKAERGESRPSGGPRVTVLGATMVAAQLLVVVGLSALSAGSGRSSAPERQARPTAHAVAHVNGTPIMSDRLELAVNALIPQESFHRAVKPEKVAELRRTALETLVAEELQYQDATRRGWSASVGEVNAGLMDVAARYQSPEAFEAARRKAGVSEATIRHEVQRTILIRKARDAAVTSQCRVDDAEAARFFEANPARFVVPEQLRIQAITVGVDPSSPPSAWAAARARAEHARQRLLGGAPFDAMAREYSTDPNRNTGGDMGFFHRGSLTDEFEKATSGLRPGQVSALVQTIYGYHLVRILEVRPSRQKSFDEVATELQKDLTAQRCAELNDVWVGRLRASADVVIVGPLVSHLAPEKGHGPAARGAAR